MASLAKIQLQNIAINDVKTLRAFYKYDIDECGISGLGVYKCDTPRLRDITRYLHPMSFHDLFEMFGCVWAFSGTDFRTLELYVTAGELSYKEIPVSQEDLCLTLRTLGADDHLAMDITYQISQGESISDDSIRRLGQLYTPNWLIDYCSTMRVNLPPRALGEELTRRAYISAWFKVNHPIAFYTVFCRDAIQNGYLKDIMDLSNDSYWLSEFEKREAGIEDTPFLTSKTITELVQRDRDHSIRASVESLYLQVYVGNG